MKETFSHKTGIVINGRFYDVLVRVDADAVALYVGRKAVMTATKKVTKLYGAVEVTVAERKSV